MWSLLRAGQPLGPLTLLGLLGLGALLLPGCDESMPHGEPIRARVVLGGLGDVPGRFAYPRCLEADAASRTLWVIDKTGRVQQIDPASGDCLSTWKMPLTENGKPTGCTVALDDDGRPLLYIADTHYHRIMIYRADEPVGRPGSDGARAAAAPTLVASFGEYGTLPGQFIFPTDIAIVPHDNGRGVRRIFVSEYGGNDRVSAFDASFRCLFTVGTYGSDSSPANVQFDRPQSIVIAHVPQAPPAAMTAAAASATAPAPSAAADSPPLPDDLELVVADARNHRLGRFSLDGQLIQWLGHPETPGDGPGQFRIPYGVQDVGDGTVLVAEFGNNRLQRIDLVTGAGLGSWGRPGRGEGELFTPWAVTTLNTTTYILDSGNNRALGFASPRRRD